MSSSTLPKAMKVWQYHATSGRLENNLKLNTAAPLPKPKPDEHLIRIFATALNPVDYKLAEVPIVSRFLISKPATPGIDIVGRIIKPAQGSSLKEGTLVFGFAGVSPLAAGGLADYVATKPNAAAVLPEGISTIDAATVGVAGMTAYQSIMPHIKAGSRVFLNGGSGGVGAFGIQIAKAAGAHVTTSCSTANVELCKSLGADEVLDYKKKSVLEQLKEQKPFNHVVDNVGGNFELYWKCHEYTNPSAKFIMIAGTPSFAFFSFTLMARLLPGWLGGGKRAMEAIFAEPKLDQLEQIGKWMVEGKVKAVIDSKFEMEKAPDAFRKLKTGRARGKIVVQIAEDMETGKQ